MICTQFRMVSLVLICLVFSSQVFAGQLQDAVKKGDAEQVRQMLTEGGNANTEDKHGRSLLHTAAFFGRKAVVEILLANGANIKKKIKMAIQPYIGQPVMVVLK